MTLLVYSRNLMTPHTEGLARFKPMPGLRYVGQVYYDARASIHDLIAWRSCERWGSTLNRTGRRWPLASTAPDRICSNDTCSIIRSIFVTPPSYVELPKCLPGHRCQTRLGCGR